MEAPGISFHRKRNRALGEITAVVDRDPRQENRFFNARSADSRTQIPTMPLCPDRPGIPRRGLELLPMIESP